MITVNDLALRFSGKKLFEDVNIKFTRGNCYGLIGANGAGKSTFLKILSGEIEPSQGGVHIATNARMAVLRQDHFAFDEYTVMDTVLMGHEKLWNVMKEKEEIYMKEDFSDADGERAAELEGEFEDMGGWEAESQASMILTGLGLTKDQQEGPMADLKGSEKVKVLLARALFGDPDILLLDEPTNHLDIRSIMWLENFLLDFEGTVIVVSHDRHFLNKVCTHMADIDFGKIKIYVGNYDFWYEASQLMMKLMKEQNRKVEEKRKELTSFIQRFSSNASKAKQATSRKRLLEKLTLEDIPASSRRYPYIHFDQEREAGKELLTVEELKKEVNGKNVVPGLSMRIDRGEKVAFVGDNEVAKTALFKVLAEEAKPDGGSFRWGPTITWAYFPKDNNAFFKDCDLNLVDWLRQFTNEDDENFIRSFLGRMLFKGEEVLKPVKVLSGGERVRCMFSRMMLSGANVLIFDEPTNHLDLESITALNNALMEYPGTIIFTSHDHKFIQTVANRIVNITEDKIIDAKLSFDDYLEREEELLNG